VLCFSEHQRKVNSKQIQANLHRYVDDVVAVSGTLCLECLDKEVTDTYQVCFEKEREAISVNDDRNSERGAWNDTCCKIMSRFNGSATTTDVTNIRWLDTNLTIRNDLPVFQKCAKSSIPYPQRDPDINFLTSVLRANLIR